MRRWWFKCSTAFWSSPSVNHLRKHCGRSELRWRRACAVYQTILGLNVEGDCDGTLPAKWCDSELIATRSMLTDKDVRQAFDDLSAAGLIDAKRGKRTLRINGWDHEWKPAKEGFERTRAWRDRQK